MGSTWPSKRWGMYETGHQRSTSSALPSPAPAPNAAPVARGVTGSVRRQDTSAANSIRAPGRHAEHQAAVPDAGRPDAGAPVERAHAIAPGDEGDRRQDRGAEQHGARPPQPGAPAGEEQPHPGAHEDGGPRAGQRDQRRRPIGDAQAPLGEEDRQRAQQPRAEQPGLTADVSLRVGAGTSRTEARTRLLNSGERGTGDPFE